MSIFSTLFGDVVKLFEGSAASNPAAQQAVADVQTAAASAEAAVAPLLDDIANAALSKIPFGVLAEPIVDAIINGVVAKLEAKLSTVVAAA